MISNSLASSVRSPNGLPLEWVRKKAGSATKSLSKFLNLAFPAFLKFLAEMHVSHYLYWGCAFEPCLRRFRGLSGMAWNPQSCESICPLVSLPPVASGGIAPNFPWELGDLGRSRDASSATSCAVTESIELRIVVASVSVDEARLEGSTYVNQNCFRE